MVLKFLIIGMKNTKMIFEMSRLKKLKIESGERVTLHILFMRLDE